MFKGSGTVFGWGRLSLESLSNPLQRAEITLQKCDSSLQTFDKKMCGGVSEQDVCKGYLFNEL